MAIRTRAVARRHDAARRIQRAHRQRDAIGLGFASRPFWCFRSDVPTCYDATALYEYIAASGDLRDPVARQPYTDRELRALAATAKRTNIDVDAIRTQRHDDTEREALLRSLEDELCSAVRELLWPSTASVAIGRVAQIDSVIHDVATLSVAALTPMVQRVAHSMHSPAHQRAASQVLTAIVGAYEMAELMA